MKSRWTKDKIGNLCNSYAGGTPNRDNSEYYVGNIPWISSGEVNQSKIYYTNEMISLKGLKFSSAKWIPKEAVLVAMYGATAGQVSKLKIKATSNQAVLAIIPHGINDNFIYYTLKYMKNQILYFAQGSGQPNLNKSLIDNFIIKFPISSTHQRKIAKILSTCDEVIEKTEIAIAKYQSIKQGMMQDLFTRGIDLTTGKLRPKYEDAPELYKESELGMIPKEWEVKPLSYYFKNITYGFTNPMPECDEGPFMITAANVINGTIDYESARKTSKLLFDTVLTNKSKPNTGDLLLTKDGTLGRLAIVDNNNICINQSVAVINFRDGINSLFFKLLLETNFYQKKMLDDAGGSTIKHIYITIVDKMLLAVPNEGDERKLILDKCVAINNKIQIEKSTLVKYQKLKSGLMQDLLTGKIEVNI